MVDKARSRVCEGDGAIITLFPDLCNRCGRCIENCPGEVLAWSEDMKDKIAVLDIGLCDACGRCQEVCSEEALKVEKNWD